MPGIPAGRRFRILTAVEDFTKESLATAPDTSITGRRLVAELDRLVERRGKPKQNAFIESFNGKLRDECLNESFFGSLVDAIEKIEGRRIDYNTVRPHSSIGNQTLAAFAAASVLAMQRGETLRYMRGFAPRPVVQTEPIGSND